MNNHFDTIVIGAGPAGILAAGTAAQKGQKTALLERNDMIGKKLLLTGGGRCNITSRVPLDDFLNAFGKSGQFLRPAIQAFNHEKLISFLTNIGISLQQDGKNLFIAGGGKTLVNALTEYLHKNHVHVFYSKRVTEIIPSPDKFKIEEFETKKIIITTGGKSYPDTGSTGDGFTLAKKLGHTITPPIPAMGPITIHEKIFEGLSGISIPQVEIEVLADSIRQGKFTGGLLITHKGISGPAVLDATLTMARAIQQNKSISLKINFKTPFENFPQRLKTAFLKSAGINTEEKTLQITRTQRQHLEEQLKSLKLSVKNTSTWESAMVTVGGVSLKEINPKTMESLITKGAYFAGEVLDLAATCGGFNIHAAMATGFLSALH